MNCRRRPPLLPLLVAVVAAALAACGGGASSDQPTEAPAARVVAVGAGAQAPVARWLACLGSIEASDRAGPAADLSCLQGRHPGRDGDAACVLDVDTRGWTLEQAGRRVHLALLASGEDERGAPVNNLEASGLPGGAGVLLSHDLAAAPDDEPVAESLAVRAMPARAGRPARVWVSWMQSVGDRLIESRCELLP